MSLAAGILPESFFSTTKKEEVIRHLINSPIPKDLKQTVLTEWAKEVGVTVTEQDRKRVGL